MYPSTRLEPMGFSARFPLLITGLASIGVLLAWSPASQSSDYRDHIIADQGFPITNQTVIDRCSRCHVVDDGGRMSRISWMRKTPEGWQTSIRRMMALHGARLNQADAVEIVRYLSNEQGLAPEELRPGMFEIERRSDDHDWDGDSDVEYTCIQCHSMGRVMTQRRTEEEWGLLSPRTEPYILYPTGRHFVTQGLRPSKMTPVILWNGLSAISVRYFHSKRQIGRHGPPTSVRLD